MTIDPRIIGIGAAILAALLIVYMPVSKRKVNQTIVSIVIGILIFVAAFSFLNAESALPVGAGIVLSVILVRFVFGGFRSFVYRNFTRYTRRDYWQRRIGQSIIGSNRRRRNDY